MFCQNCGRQNPDGTAFCSNCGSALNGAPAAPVAPVTPVVPAPAAVPGKGLGIASMVVGIISLVMFCTGWFAIICAIVGTVLGGVALKKAKDAGATVVCYDRLITGTDAVDYYVTFDSFAVGVAQGQYLIDNAPAGSGIPLYLYAGAATDNNAFIFFEGAWSVLQPKIADGTFVIANSTEAEGLADKAELTRDELGAIIGQVTTDWDFNVAKSKAEAHLTAVGAEAKGESI